MREDIDRLLNRVAVLRHACDLDLLVFFARHPRTLVTSEQLATWLGHDLKQMAQSLEVLLDAGFITRTQNATHAARLYVFAIGGSNGGWLPALLKLASTRAGRLAMMTELLRRTSTDTKGPVTRPEHQTGATSSRRPFVVRRPSDQTPDTKVG